ncbi:hypothetical protein ACFPES_13250 [Paenibacillus sp. GCM10023248]|nr:hypothetical protein [Paenibacillus sp. MAHUQ-63]
MSTRRTASEQHDRSGRGGNDVMKRLRMNREEARYNFQSSFT